MRRSITIYEDGDAYFGFDVEGDFTVAEALGWLELAKSDIIDQSREEDVE